MSIQFNRFRVLKQHFFYWQTDLCGLKWRKYIYNVACRATFEEDPVLKSFSLALGHDILCAWRRSPSTGCQASSDPNSISSAKELWVFWFGDDPNLQGIVSGELKGEFFTYTKGGPDCMEVHWTLIFIREGMKINKICTKFHFLKTIK